VSLIKHLNTKPNRLNVKRQQLMSFPDRTITTVSPATVWAREAHWNLQSGSGITIQTSNSEALADA
jgi:hypothetical protein